MTPSPARSAILRTLCFHEAWNYLPTRAELVCTLDVGDDGSLSRDAVTQAVDELVTEKVLHERMGRIGVADRFDGMLEELRRRDPLQPRKRRAARRVVRWLSHLPGVRFVALANTTALGNARDEGDLDFFVIVRAGTIWSTRLLGGGPFKLMGKMPTVDNSRDAVCLSYFIADEALDLSSHALAGDDPYFRHWLLALLPLYDDGISSEFWNANASLRSRHPFAQKWIVPPDLQVDRPAIRIPTGPIESVARAFQMRWFPAEIRSRMNKDTTVMVNDSVLKFHVTDGREDYRARYEALCRINNVTP